MSDLYYDEKYFEWQKRVGEFGGKANLFKFKKYIKDDNDILDFGCGGGYLLKNIYTHGKKIGIEINPTARETARQNGIFCLDDIKKVEDNSIDVLITNHALEHVDNPMIYVREFKRVVRNNGKIVIAVPHEISNELKPCDINMHLYTWSPQNLYNLLTTCGIDTISCERLSYAWVPNYMEVQQQVGWEEFHRLCRRHAEKNNIYQTIAVGVVIKNANKDDDKIIRSPDGIYNKYFDKINREWNDSKRIIKKYKKIAIYGAGTAGKRIYKFLIENGYSPDCFVVSSTKIEQIVDGEIEIISFDDLNDKQEYLFILGIMSQMTKESVKTQLRNNGCDKILDFNIDIINCLSHV